MIEQRHCVVDPITIEVVRSGLVAAADEMRLGLMRASYNPIIYEVLDFSLGLFDERGDMIAQALGLPAFLGNLGAAVTAVRDQWRDRFSPGDVFLINDMYVTGTHLNDVTVVAPVFIEQRLVAFTASRAHWLDMGGKSPGGACDSTDIYQEGLRLNAVRLYAGGEVDRSVLSIIEHNVRNPDAQLGDLRAQIAAARIGEARLGELVDRFGLDVVLAVSEEIKRQGELVARAAVADIPDGEYGAVGWLDNDGVGEQSVRIEVTVTVAGDEMTIDVSGSSPQVLGPINMSYPGTLSICRVALKCVTAPLGHVSEGSFAPLMVVVPDDCVFNAQLPAAGFVNGVTDILLFDLIMKALSEAIPERIPAAHYGDMAGFMIFGSDDQGQLFIQQEPEGGGWGACPHRDGENVLIFIADGDTRNVPVEVIESRYPLRINRYQLREDSGGAGKFRGGLGHYRDYVVLVDEAWMTAIMEREVCPPWGLEGGGSGQHDVIVINPRTDKEQRVMKVTGWPLVRGDVVSVRTGGGGGYGCAVERDVDKVAADVLAGYVTVAAAYRQYGVKVNADGCVDMQETIIRRQMMREKGRSGSG